VIGRVRSSWRIFAQSRPGVRFRERYRLRQSRARGRGRWHPARLSYLVGGAALSEVIRGLGGDDEISDGLGKDAVYGNEGADNLIGYGGDTSVDRFYGGTGDDTIQSRDVPDSKDRVRCGPGVDRVYADKADVVSENCERVRAW
jgi:hypothetical protein